MARLICDWCGEEYDSGSVKRRINKLFKEPGFYDEVIDNHLCFECARDYIEENLDAGLDLDYELATGMDRSERPADWDFSF